MAAKKTRDVEGPEAESPESLGARLRGAREAQEISIEAVAAELRIGAEYLTALEEGRFEVVGPQVFAKGYLKHYGARLGLDVAELVAEYERTCGEPGIQIAPTREIGLGYERNTSAWMIAVAALVIVAAAASIWWWLAVHSGTNPVP